MFRLMMIICALGIGTAVHAGVLDGKKLLIDTNVDLDASDSGKTNKGRLSVSPVSSGDRVYVEMFIEDGAGVAIIGFELKFANNNSEFSSNFTIDDVTSIGAIRALGSPGSNAVAPGGLTPTTIPSNGYFGTLILLAKKDISAGTTITFVDCSVGLATFDQDYLDASQAVITFGSVNTATLDLWFDTTVESSLSSNADRVNSKRLTTRTPKQNDQVEFEIFVDQSLVGDRTYGFELKFSDSGFTDNFVVVSLEGIGALSALSSESSTTIGTAAFFATEIPSNGYIGKVTLGAIRNVPYGASLQLQEASIITGSSLTSLVQNYFDVSETTISFVEIEVIEAIAGDLDFDGDVDLSDFITFALNFGKTGPVPTNPWKLITQLIQGL